MVKKRVIVYLCIFIFVLLSLFTSLQILNLNYKSISGRGVTGQVLLRVGGGFDINIISPENKTYNFTKTQWQDNNMTIALNVTSNSEIDSWWYNLTDLRHDETVNDSVFFIPNSSIKAVRWKNKLGVYANNTNGEEVNDTVQFYVHVPNSAPEIINLSSNYSVCENTYLSEFFKVRDLDEDQMKTEISPRNPFYTEPLYTEEGETVTIIEIFSGRLDEEDAGFYEETLSANDQYSSSCCVATGKTNITVIEINDKPAIEDVGVKTVWTRGDNSTFYKEITVSDEEDGNRTSSNITFNISFSGTRLFNISNKGVINFTADNETETGVYSIKVCANDSGISNPHEDIEDVCNQTGLSRSSCDDFTLTVTDENRRPTITDYYPEDLSFNASGTEALFFNITKYDADGTIPDAYWYADDGFVEKDSGNSTDNLSYSFGCGVKGEHTLKAEITDGLLNDSVEWVIDVIYVECPVVSGGGGGGGGISTCLEKWGCGGWTVCQNAKKTLEKGTLSGEDYRFIREECKEERYNESVCGVQFRNCIDANNCNTEYNKPREVQTCFYISKPSCSDGIKNCHHGLCELMIDCGGPCKPCPTCSDGIQNQGEWDVDCGGPCPPCPPEMPLKKARNVRYVLIVAIVILVSIITTQLLRLFKIFKKIKEYKRK